MTYLLFAFPAELAADVDAAIPVYERCTDAPGPTPPDAPVVPFVAAVLDLPGVQAEAAGEGAHVAVPDEDPMTGLSAVAAVAREHGLSVLDPQLAALFDPRLAAEVALDTEGGPRLPFTTRRILLAVVAEIAAGAYHWVSLRRDGGRFAQAFRDDDSSWAVEHRDVRGEHFAARTSDDETVAELLWSWTRGDDRWAAMLAFAPITV